MLYFKNKNGSQRNHDGDIFFFCLSEKQLLGMPRLGVYLRSRPSGLELRPLHTQHPGLPIFMRDNGNYLVLLHENCPTSTNDARGRQLLHLDTTSDPGRPGTQRQGSVFIYTSPRIMDVANITAQLDQLDGDMDKMEETVKPLIANLSEIAAKLPLLDKAKLYVLAAYTIETALFSKTFPILAFHMR